MEIAGWRIWYTGGRVFDSLTTAVSALPTTGVLVALLYFAAEYAPGLPYRGILKGNDRYWYDPATGLWGQSDETVQQIKRRLGNQVYVWTGSWADTAEFRQAIGDAMNATVL